MTDIIFYLSICAINIAAGILNGNPEDGAFSVWVSKFNMFCAGLIFMMFLDKVFEKEKK